VENKATKLPTVAQTHDQEKAELVTEVVAVVEGSKERATTGRGPVTVSVIASRRIDTKAVIKLMLQKEKAMKRKKSQT
jgi:hypothetical protein